jgi:acid-sensing ion channel, other
MAQVCDPEMFAGVDPENRTNCEKCVSILRELMQDIDRMMDYCVYKSKSRICSKIFKDVMTEEGNCFTFNGFHVFRKHDGKPFNDTKEWSLDDGYRNGTTRTSVFPRTGTKSGLTIQMSMLKDRDDGLCKGPFRGFKLYVHLPNESPLMAKHSYLVPYKQYVQFLVDPKVITTSPEIRNFPVRKRQCYFSNERYLRFFKYYTQNNCEAECVANLTLSECHCLRFHLPSRCPR